MNSENNMIRKSCSFKNDGIPILFVYMKMSKRGKFTDTENIFVVDQVKRKEGRNGFWKGDGFE